MAGSLKELAAHRFARAEEELGTAELLLKNFSFRSSLNRSYYAIFHAVRAVNALDGFDSSKHSGVIAHFNQEHVKTGEFPKSVSKIIRNASELREQADYEDFYTATREDAEAAFSGSFHRICKRVSVFSTHSRITSTFLLGLSDEAGLFYICWDIPKPSSGSSRSSSAICCSSACSTFSPSSPSDSKF